MYIYIYIYGLCVSVICQLRKGNIDQMTREENKA